MNRRKAFENFIELSKTLDEEFDNIITNDVQASLEIIDDILNDFELKYHFNISLILSNNKVKYKIEPLTDTGETLATELNCYTQMKDFGLSKILFKYLFTSKISEQLYTGFKYLLRDNDLIRKDVKDVLIARGKSEEQMVVYSYYKEQIEKDDTKIFYSNNNLYINMDDNTSEPFYIGVSIDKISKEEVDISND